MTNSRINSPWSFRIQIIRNRTLKLNNELITTWLLRYYVYDVKDQSKACSWWRKMSEVNLPHRRKKGLRPQAKAGIARNAWNSPLSLSKLVKKIKRRFFMKEAGRVSGWVLKIIYNPNVSVSSYSKHKYSERDLLVETVQFMKNHFNYCSNLIG